VTEPSGVASSGPASLSIQYPTGIQMKIVWARPTARTDFGPKITWRQGYQVGYFEEM
jgi:hypothetical protein